MNIHQLLARKYNGDEWIFLEEVRDMPGFRSSNSLDAVAMGMWMSRGCELIGFEVKVSRSDWLRELKNPKKAEVGYDLVDRFYLVSEKDVAQDSEIPATWGWLEKHGLRLIEKRKAPQKTQPQEDLDRYFVAMMLRRAKVGMPTDPSKVREMARKIANEEMESERLTRGKCEDKLVAKITELENELRKFKGALGVFSISEIAPLLDVVRKLKAMAESEKWRSTPADAMDRIAKELRETANALTHGSKNYHKMIQVAMTILPEKDKCQPSPSS